MRNLIPRGLDIKKKKELSIVIWRLATDTCWPIHAVVRFLSPETFESRGLQLRFIFKLVALMLVSSPFESELTESSNHLNVYTNPRKPTEKSGWNSLKFVCWIRTWRVLCSVTWNYPEERARINPNGIFTSTRNKNQWNLQAHNDTLNRKILMTRHKTLSVFLLPSQWNRTTLNWTVALFTV